MRLLCAVFIFESLIFAAFTQQTTLPVSTTSDLNLYLFVDDYWIAEKTGIERIVNQAKPLEQPIITPDDPTTQTECAWGNVIRDQDGRFRMWYCTLHMGINNLGPHEMAAAGVWGKGDDFSYYPRGKGDVRDVDLMLGKYAESDDGITWTKPSLGLITFEGSKNNNIILNGQRAAEETQGALTNFDGYTVLRDDAEENPEKRYKMLAHWESIHFWDNHEANGSLGRSEERMKAYAAARGKYITYSPDGIHWNESLERIKFPDGGGDRFLVIRDHRNAQWWGYSRSEGHGGAALATSKDLINWSPPEALPALHADAIELPAIECMIPFNYGNQDLGFAVAMDKSNGLMYSYLVSHHDGEPWQWVDTKSPFIPLGTPSSYNSTGAVPLHNEPFVMGDKLYIFFNSFANTQKSNFSEGMRTIGLATLRRDGFVGLLSSDNEGIFLTKPIRVTGPRMFANVEQCESDGMVLVALLHTDGTPIAKFTADDAIPITADAVRYPVTWQAGNDLSELVGQEVVLSVRMTRGCVVYAFTFSD